MAVVFLLPVACPHCVELVASAVVTDAGDEWVVVIPDNQQARLNEHVQTHLTPTGTDHE